MATGGAATAISAPVIFDGTRFLEDHCLITQSGLVTQLLATSDCAPDIARITLTSGILAPGFIDLQVNGGGDLMFNNNPYRAALGTMFAAHRRTGTTAMMPTLISDTPAQQELAVAAVREAIAGDDPGILGIHLEGPFFASARRGAHRADMIRPSTDDDIAWLCTLADLRVIVTLAPELAAAGQIGKLSKSGIHVCAGHSNATRQQMVAAVAEGMAGVTHLYNAMSQLTPREPGVVGATLEEKTLWAGIIADGHHVHPANIRLAHESKPPGRLLLVTDAMATVGGTKTSFSLYGETISARDGKLVNEEGVLAGSAIGMIDAVAYAANTVGIPLAESLRMASLYPAAVLKLDHQRGRIAPGYRADLVHFDEQYRVHNTWVGGLRQTHYKH